MAAWSKNLVPLSDRGPLRVMFVATEMTVGGEEILLADLVRRLDRSRFVPEICLMKEAGELGEALAREIPVFPWMLSNKFDVRVLPRVIRLLRSRHTDAVVTVGTGGDKMFWGRLAARYLRLPVIVSAIHSTGFPIRVEWSNRRLARFTDAFIAVAERHGQYIAEHEGCPAAKIRVIPNGVDTDKFRPLPRNPQLRQELGVPDDAPLAGIVAMIRHEKNHALWLRMAADVHRQLPSAHFLIVGDGPDRQRFEQMARELGLGEAAHFCGLRQDIPALLSLLDVFVLSSDMEANPVSILEAMACGRPVVSTRVGSIPESVVEGVTGFLVEPGNQTELAERVLQLLSNRDRADQMGVLGRQRVVEHFSVDRMVEGYQDLLEEIYLAKCSRSAGLRSPRLRMLRAEATLADTRSFT